VNREEKAAVIDELRGVFSDAAAVVVTHYKGLSVAEITDLRSQIRAAGASYKVAKNRLVKIALEGTPYAGLTDSFSGPTAIAYSDDPVAAAKAAVEFAKKNEKLIIVRGGMADQVLEVDAVKALADLPSLDDLRAKLIGLLNAPATKVAQVTQAPAAKLARVLNAYATKEDA
jgi:large subunit ribosomal protein L10